MSRLAGKALLLAALAASPLGAQDTSKNSILQNKADQQDLRQHTAVLAQQIQSLIDELTENGISGDDAKVLTTTKAVLNNLSAQEMERVLASLQKAGDAAGTKDGEKNLVDAYGTQKGIILQFRQILKDYEQRQAADELPAKFKELTDRQTQIMWTTAQVASDSAGKSQQELNTTQQTTSQIVQTDQNALINDVAMAKQMLEKAAQNATGDQGRAMQQAQKDLTDGKLQATLDKANADLAAGHLLQATSEQKAARDMLRQLSKDLNPPTTTADALADFAATLNKIIDEQKDLLVQTNAAVDVKPRVTGLDVKQGLLVDKTNSLQEDMQALSPAPAALVKDALMPMQLARANLGPRAGQFPKAAASEQDAIDKLQQAAQQVGQQVADAQKAAADAAKDSTQKLQQLQQQIQQAQQAQQQVAQTTTQAQSNNDAGTLNQAQQQQAQLQQATQNMQQTAAPLSLPTSQALSNAQQAMQQAQQALNNGQAQQAQQAQQAAQQALQQANQAAQQAIAQNQQQATDPNQLAQAANQLQQAQSAVSNAQAAAQQAGAQQANAQQQQAGAQQANAQQQAGAQQANAQQQQAGAQQANAQQQAGSQQSGASMQQAQQALAQAAQATQAAAATQGLPDAAQSAIQNAQKDIAQGQQAAAQGNAQATANAASAAQASLAQAQAAVAVAQAGMTPSPSSSMAGGPPKPGSPMPGTPGDMPTPPMPDQASMDGAKMVSGGSTDKGQLHDTTGKGKFITVMSRDRTAISETQAETRPQEYSPMIDQYLKNLSDQATASSGQ